MYEKLSDECQPPKFEVDGILILDQYLRTHVLPSSDQTSNPSLEMDNGSSPLPYLTTSNQCTIVKKHPSSS